MASFESREIRTILTTKNQGQRELSRFRGGLDGVTRAARMMGIGLGAAGLAAFARSVADASMRMESMQNALKAVTGSTEGAAAEIGFVREEAERLGLDLETAADSYTKLAAASKGTAIAGEETRDIFAAVAEASTVLGLSAADTTGALTAIGQMMSKGNVQAEELRGQLGERIPGAFQLAARAMDVTTQQLNDMLDQGKVLADDFLPRFARELRATYAEALPEAVNSSRASMNRLQTAIFGLKTEIGDSGFMASMNEGMNRTAEILGSQEMKTGIRAFGDFVGVISDNGQVLTDVLDGMAYAFKDVRDHIRDIKSDLSPILENKLVQFLIEKGPRNALPPGMAALSAYGEARRLIDSPEGAVARGGTRVAIGSDTAGFGGYAGSGAGGSGAEDGPEAAIEAMRERRFNQRRLEAQWDEEDRAANQTAYERRWRIQAEQEQALLELKKESAFELRMFTMEQQNEQREFEEEQTLIKLERLKREEEERARIISEGETYVMNMRRGNIGMALGLMQQFAGESKAIAIAGLAIQKGLAISETYINTQSAAAAALAPPPLGLGPALGEPLAAAIETQGYIRMGLIAATGLMDGARIAGSKSSGFGYGGGTPNSPIVTQTPAPSGPQDITIRLITDAKGAFTAEAVEETLIPHLNRANRRGVKIIVETQ